jgi:anti-sigma-K factor RskA
MDHRGEFNKLFSLYALGLLEGEDLKKVEEHLKTGCEECKEVFKETESVLSLLPYSLRNSPLSPELRNKVWERIESAEKAKEQSSAPDFWSRFQPIRFKLGGAVALASLLLLFISNMSLKNSLTMRQQELSRMREQVSSQSEMMEFVESPNVVVISFTAPQPTSKAHGKLFWNTKTREALFCALNIPASGDRRTYQFWAVEDDAVVSMGMFKVDRSGTKMMKLKSMPERHRVKKFIVTIEPEGGMAKPNGEVYLAGWL